MDFMSSAVKSLENTKFIEKYAWFGLNPTTDPNLGPSALYNEKSDYSLTDLGKLYARLP